MRELLAAIATCSTVLWNLPAFADRLDEPAALTEALSRLVRGNESGRVLLVEVTADWCAPCNQLATEVLETPVFAELVGKDLSLRVDFESDEGQAIKRRFGVLGLPTLLVVGADGRELGRVEGYDGRAEWVEAVKDARAGRFGLAALEAAAARDPADDTAALSLAQARLLAGDKAALDSLDAMIAGGFVPAPDEPREGNEREAGERLARAAHAARVKGRWLLRAREDGVAALGHFTEMARRFAGTPHAAHFLYWQANALDLLGRRDEAVKLFEGWRDEPGQMARALAYQADFMVLHAYPGALEVAHLHHAATPSADSHYLLSRALASTHPAEAIAHARAAVALEPATALYQNHLKKLTP